MRRLFDRYRHDRRGAAAVEFAFVAMFFILTVLFVMIVGVLTYFRLSLDLATSKAARQIMIGAAAKNGLTQSQLISTLICPYLPYGMTCSKVIVNVYSVAEAPGPAGYYAYVNSGATAVNTPMLDNSASTYNLGAQNTYQYMQVVYPFTEMPSAIAKYLGGGSSYQGSPAFLLMSSATFKNEQY